MTDAASGNIQQEMGYNAVEFANVLPRAMRDWRVDPTGSNAWRILDVDEVPLASIHITPLPDRRIAMLSLPALKVEIDFATDDAPKRSEFMRRFDRGFQKGGG